MKDFIDKLTALNLSLAIDKGDLVLKGKKGKLTKAEIALVKQNKDVIQFIKEHKAQLIDYLKETGAASSHKSKKIEGIYGLSPMQEGMLFHSLYDTQSDAYYTQFRCNIACPVNVEMFREAWQQILHNHSILRSSFHHDAMSIPVQTVYKEVELPFQLIDFSAFGEEEQEEKLAAFLAKDKQNKFKFDQAPLLRITLIKRSEALFTMVWTHHHILLDGWSMPIVMGELMSNYEHLYQGHALPELPADRYEDYIKYITKQNEGYPAESFWKEYLAGLDQACLLPFVPSGVDRNKGGGSVGECHLLLSVEDTEKLRAYAQQNHLTVNTIAQGVWALLLARYTGNSNVVFGVTVSGRPADLEGAEKRVGLYINTLLLHAELADDSIVEWLTNLQKGTSASQEYQFTPLNKIQTWSGLKGEFFDTSLVFENYPLDEALAQDWALKIVQVDAEERNNFLLSLTAVLNNQLSIGFKFNKELLPTQAVERMTQHFSAALEQIVEKEHLSDIKIITPEEEKEILETFNKTTVPYRKDASLIGHFQHQAQQQPQAIALADESETMTYEALWQKSNQLRQYLEAQGIGKGDFVGICLERSPEMIISILGILGTGAAYVAIDPEYPDTRIDYMLEDAHAKWVITNSFYDRDLMMFNTLFEERDGITSIIWDELNAELDGFDGAKEINSIAFDNPAYVMYTSGTTGQPKGILVTHQNVIKLACETTDIAINADDKVLQWSNYVFDGSIYDIFGSLLNGAALHLITKEQARDAGKLAEVIRQREVSVCFMTTALFNAFVDYDVEALKGLRKLLFGGQLVSVPHVKRALEAVGSSTLVHVYGPTETTVYATYYPIQSVENDLVPIGGPLSNTVVYILDQSTQPTGIGIVGEIYIGGDGVSKGYLNKEALTEERFVPNPFGAGKLYKTGDLARWLPNGTIDFVGRQDDQVKIRGYRIELGEVETVLQQAPQVKQCIVVVNSNESGTKKLVAYVVPESNYAQKEVLEFLQVKLPEYMIPSVLVELAELPLTANGKVDKKALPSPEVNTTKEDNYLAPSSKIEKDLVQIWEKLLNTNRVGVNDNFFELGGDSIITIQVASRAKKLGYSLQPHLVFENPTISQLAKMIDVQEEQAMGEQGMLKGHSPLIPVQEWFLTSENPEKSHFNQDMLLGLDKSISEVHLQQVIVKLFERHDALRFSYQFKLGKWQQKYEEQLGELQVKDLSAIASEEELTEAITATCNAYQRSLSIETGEIARFVWIKTPAFSEYNRLLIIIHHLAVDGVSWRIIMDDLESSLKSLAEGEAIEFGPKTHSFREWGNALATFANSKKVNAEIDYWENVMQHYAPIPTDKQEGASTWGMVRNQYAALEVPQTSALLQQVGKAYGTEINDILLAALLYTFHKWSAQAQLVIGLEGHGREVISDAIDTSNTVGWFTNLYPIALAFPTAHTLRDLVISVKEQLRLVPNKGMGFGALKYLHASNEVREKFSNAKWDIIFNYLGQFDQLAGGDSFFKPAPESRGDDASPDTPFQYKLSISGSIAGGQLMMSWAYSPNDYHPETIEQLSTLYISCLKEIIEHCASQTERSVSPADFQLSKQVTYQELDNFLANSKQKGNSITSMYRLSPLQEGMLFHKLFDDTAAAYTNQFQSVLSSRVNISALQKSWQRIINQHTIFKTSFHHHELALPVQCVHETTELPFEFLDYSELSAEEQQATLADFLKADKEKGFDFSTPPLMRITLLKWAEDSFSMIWTHHHILLDGWSIPTVIGELMGYYESYINGNQPAFKETDEFEDYIRFIQSKDEFEEAAFWQGYLANFEAPSLLPFINTNTQRNTNNGTTEECEIFFDETLTEQIKRYAQENKLTVNTLIQGVWSLLLSRYTGQHNVLFGATVSGRPSSLEHAEERVGIYINTIPMYSEVIPTSTTVDWLTRIQEGHTAARAFQYTSLNQVMTWTGVRGELFDSLLVFENYPMDAVEGKVWELQFEHVSVEEQTNYPFTITAELRNRLNIYLTYNTSLITAEYAEYIKRHFEQAIHEIAIHKKQFVQDIRLASPQELEHIRTEFNPSLAHATPEYTLVEVFEQQVEASPDAIALTFEGESMTYEALNAQANQLAHYLQDKGIQQNSRVAMCMDRSPLMIVGMMGILKAGATYIPISTEQPSSKVQFILKDAAVAAVLTQQAYHEKLQGEREIPIITMDDEPVYGQAPTVNLAPFPLETLAYIIYTSGSTGTPKGVMVSHLSLIDRLQVEMSLVEADHSMVTCFLTNYAFDVSLLEIFLPLLCGGKIAISPSHTTHTLEDKLAICLEQQVSILQGTPSFFSAFMELVRPGIAQQLALATICIGGESLTASLAQQIKSKLPAVRLNNHYGPTETTIDALVLEDVTDFETNSIGKPLPHTNAYILHDDLSMAAIGEVGELCIAGVSVADGYLNQAKLTATKFMSSPFDETQKLYKTGDLARWLPSGEVEFLGRKDTQIKIRGYRIELGEIERALNQAPGVQQAVVCVKPDKQQNQLLVAYVVPQSHYDMEVVQYHLKAHLPAYMIPAFLVEIDHIPLTANGKVDTATLLALEDEQSLQTYIAPRNDFEQRIATIWSEFLSVNQVGISSHFFDLGGHSINAVKVVAKMNRVLGTRLTVRELFMYPTIEALVKQLKQGQEAEPEYIDLKQEAVLDESIVPTKNGQKTSSPQHIFMTGATGFVGGFLLRELMTIGDATIHCLVRANSDGEALLRIQQNLENYELWDDSYAQRINAYAGELGAAQFNLSTAQYEALVKKIDVVYHNASYMNHFASYEQMKAANVHGLQEVLRFACTGRQKMLHYTSTMAIFSMNQSRTITENTPIDEMQHLRTSGYEGSKWVAEKIIEIARQRGIPCNMYRLGLITGDTQKGRYTTSQWFYKLMKCSLLLNASLNKDFDIPVDATPVDFAAKALVRLSQQPELHNRNFNISNKEYSTTELFKLYSAQATTPLQELRLSEWISRAKNYVLTEQELPLPSFIQDFMGYDEQTLLELDKQLLEDWEKRDQKVQIQIDNSITQEELEKLGLSFPKIDQEIMVKYFDYIQRKSLIASV
ncbi:MAG: amino acid adenylation domain-containing protein [Flammeovirgaceae bacterium]